MNQTTKIILISLGAIVVIGAAAYIFGFAADSAVEVQEGQTSITRNGNVNEASAAGNSNESTAGSNANATIMPATGNVDDALTAVLNDANTERALSVDEDPTADVAEETSATSDFESTFSNDEL